MSKKYTKFREYLSVQKIFGYSYIWGIYIISTAINLYLYKFKRFFQCC